ncbi:MAG: ABC transporter permease [Candidatus Dormibacteraeota bacterium]|nr:ABC transporter permease [Candidatus Dormibacteraeota bacterium]
MTATLAYLRFELQRTLRTRGFLLFVLGFPVLFYLLLKDTAGTGFRPLGIPFAGYYMVCMAGFGAMITAINSSGPRLAAERSSGWNRQLRVTPLPGWAYLSTKVLTSLLLTLPVMVVVMAVAAVFGPVHISAVTALELLVALMAGSLTFAAAGVLLGYAISSDTANPMINGGLLLLAYFGGLFEPVAAMAAWQQQIAYVTPTYQLAAVGWWVLGGRTPLLPHALALLAYLIAFSALALWRVEVDEARSAA